MRLSPVARVMCSRVCADGGGDGGVCVVPCSERKLVEFVMSFVPR